VQGGEAGEGEEDVGGAEDGTADDDVEGFVVGDHVRLGYTADMRMVVRAAA